MPADYEMLVSRSPPVYSHSPPNGFLSNYRAYRFNQDAYCNSTRNCRVTSATSFPPFPPKSTAPPSPRRPCLVIRPEDCTSSDEDPTSPTRLKKKVVFADDKGMSLTHVRVMTEPSNVPPVWTNRFLAQVTQGINAEPLAESEPWELTFSQPASDYVDFRKRLDVGKVSLENVIVKEGEDYILGTVKVSNLSYHKEVFVRWSSDNWNTHEDVFCKYVANGNTNATSSAYVLFDTFSFKLNLPPKCRKIEFCVCFRCEGKEYWDNNGGQNYVIVKKIKHELIRKPHTTTNITTNGRNETDSCKIQKKCEDAMQAKLETWSEFASWTHLENSNPYW